MAPRQYSPLSIPQGLMQQNPNYGDMFLQSYNDQLKTSYADAVNRRQEAQLKRDEIEQEKQMKQDAAEQEIANRVMQSGATDYEGISSIEEDVYKEFGMSENLLKKYKERMQIEAATAKAAQDAIMRVGNDVVDFSNPKDPQTLYTAADKGRAPKKPITLYDKQGNPVAVSGDSTPADLQSYYNQGLAPKNPKAMSTIEQMMASQLGMNNNPNAQAMNSVDTQVSNFKKSKEQAQKELADLQRLKQEKLKNGR